MRASRTTCSCGVLLAARRPRARGRRRAGTSRARGAAHSRRRRATPSAARAAPALHSGRHRRRRRRRPRAEPVARARRRAREQPTGRQRAACRAADARECAARAARAAASCTPRRPALAVEYRFNSSDSIRKAESLSSQSHEREALSTLNCEYCTSYEASAVDAVQWPAGQPPLTAPSPVRHWQRTHCILVTAQSAANSFK